jgi:hypothetical protein
LQRFMIGSPKASRPRICRPPATCLRVCRPNARREQKPFSCDWTSTVSFRVGGFEPLPCGSLRNSIATQCTDHLLKSQTIEPPDWMARQTLGRRCLQRVDCGCVAREASRQSLFWPPSLARLPRRRAVPQSDLSVVCHVESPTEAGRISAWGCGNRHAELHLRSSSCTHVPKYNSNDVRVTARI